MTDDMRKITEFQAKSFNTILDAMINPRKKCQLCGHYTHYLDQGLCYGCWQAEYGKECELDDRKDN